MSARILDGRAAAERVMQRLQAELANCPVRPGFATVLVGGGRAARTHARYKHEAGARLGFHLVSLDLSEHTPTVEVVRALQALGSSPEVHGILVQFPLPSSIDAEAVVRAIPLEKDVDACHPETLASAEPRFFPATAAGVLELLEGLPIAGARLALLGDSALVQATGRLLRLRGAVPGELAQADLVIAGDGCLTGDMLAPGASVIDLGCGTVDFASVSRVAGAVSPVPGGVGPITVAMLMAHTLQAARA